jgi:hypothetical protein
VVALGALFVLGLVLPHDHMSRRDIDHLSPFPTARRNRSQVLLARFTTLDWLESHLIGSRRPMQGRTRMSWLSACFLFALLAQTHGIAHKAAGGRRQVAIVAIFRQPILQGFHLLTQTGDLLLHLVDLLIPLRQHFTQDSILFSQVDELFFCRHARTLPGLKSFGKSSADLGSYKLLSNLYYIDLIIIISPPIHNPFLTASGLNLKDSVHNSPIGFPF